MGINYTCTIDLMTCDFVDNVPITKFNVTYLINYDQHLISYEIEMKFIKI